MAAWPPGRQLPPVQVISATTRTGIALGRLVHGLYLLPTSLEMPVNGSLGQTVNPVPAPPDRRQGRGRVRHGRLAVAVVNAVVEYALSTAGLQARGHAAHPVQRVLGPPGGRPVRCRPRSNDLGGRPPLSLGVLGSSPPGSGGSAPEAWPPLAGQLGLSGGSSPLAREGRCACSLVSLA